MRRNITIPQSKIKDFCQPLHKGSFLAGASPRPTIKIASLSNKSSHKLSKLKHHTRSPGLRWGASRLPPVVGGRRRASGSGRCATQLHRQQGAHRAPQQENIFAPMPRMKPSGAVNIGRSVFCRNGSKSFDIAQIIGIYTRLAIWYNKIK